MSTHDAKDVERLRKQERWQAAVRETMNIWEMPQDEADELVAELYWNAQDQAALAQAKAEMPKEQARIQDAAMHLADALALGLLASPAVERLRDALAQYDGEVRRRYHERSTST